MRIVSHLHYKDTLDKKPLLAQKIWNLAHLRI